MTKKLLAPIMGILISGCGGSLDIDGEYDSFCNRYAENSICYNETQQSQQAQLHNECENRMHNVGIRWSATMRYFQYRTDAEIDKWDELDMSESDRVDYYSRGYSATTTGPFVGDCEDFSLSLADVLLKKGIVGRDQINLVYGSNIEGYHYWLTIKDGCGNTYVVDNIGLRPDHNASGYDPIKRLEYNNVGIFISY